MPFEDRVLLGRDKLLVPRLAGVAVRRQVDVRQQRRIEVIGKKNLVALVRRLGAHRDRQVDEVGFLDLIARLDAGEVLIGRAPIHDERVTLNANGPLEQTRFAQTRMSRKQPKEVEPRILGMNDRNPTRLVHKLADAMPNIHLRVRRLRTQGTLQFRSLKVVNAVFGIER